MDVFPETWPYRHLVAEGLIEGPPHHGLGRGFKAAKEEIVGLLTALQLYQKRDLENELRTWSMHIQIIVKGLAGLDGIKASFVYPGSGGRPVPEAHIQVDKKTSGMTAWEIINELQNGDPIIAVYESFAASGLLVVFPETFRDDEPEIIVQRLKEILFRQPSL